ncbi:MAG: hypothetical protein ABIB71_05685 [Candidatus Woesearchaeota archaeon]
MIEVPKDYPYEVKSINVKGKEVVVCGVVHNHKSYVKYKDFLEEAIKDSCGIVFEADIEDLKKGLKDDDFEGPAVALFAAAANFKKDLYKVDPWNGQIADVLLDKYRALRNPTDRKALLKIIFELLEKKLEDRDEPITPIEMSIYRAMSFQFNLIHWDYRETGIGEGLDKIINLEKDLKTGYLLAIHGADHTEGIAYYLENPDERKATLEGYHSQGIKGQETVRKHSFIDDKWVKVYEGEY